MAKLVRWFKRLLCLLFGCRMAAINLQSRYDERTEMCEFRNWCIRCGKEHRCIIPMEDLLEHEPIRLEEYNG